MNALKLGVRLMAAAANPFSGLTRQCADRGQWQPVNPFGLPRWWPFCPGGGQKFAAEEIGLMRSVLPPQDLHHSPHELISDAATN